jgi:hypothetical protein
MTFFVARLPRRRPADRDNIAAHALTSTAGEA